jgi:Arc/MetJ family transcription regulator
VVARAVYDWCLSRTDVGIDIDDPACRVVMERFGLDSARDAVNLALRRLAAEPFDRGDARATERQLDRR